MIYQGDCLEVLRTLPDESIHCCVTSPPYWGLRDYGTAKWEGGNSDCPHKYTKSMPSGRSSVGQRSHYEYHHPYKGICELCGAKRIDGQIGLEDSFHEYIHKLCNIFDEVKRVLRKDGTCWVNLGDTYAGSMQGYGATKDSATGFQKAPVNAGFYAASKDRPPMVKCGLPNKSLVQIPSRFAIEMVDRGWILRNELIWHKPNVIPQSMRDRFTVDFEKLFFFVKSKKYWFEQQFEKSVDPESYTGRRPRNAGSMYYVDPKHYSIQLRDDGKQATTGKVFPNRNKRTVWRITTKGFKEAHFAVFPETLIETPIKAGCPAGGVVLDPFIGSGTTAVVALKQGKNFIGIELNPEYIKIAEKRIAKVQEQMKLQFSEAI